MNLYKIVNKKTKGEMTGFKTREEAEKVAEYFFFKSPYSIIYYKANSFEI